MPWPAISNQMDTGDVTTLANPDVVEQIRVMVQGSRPVVKKDVPEDVTGWGRALVQSIEKLNCVRKTRVAEYLRREL